MTDPSAIIKLQSCKCCRIRGAQCRLRHDPTALRLLKHERYKKQLEEQLTSSGVRLLRYTSNGPPVLCVARIAEIGQFRHLDLETYPCSTIANINRCPCRYWYRCKRVETVNLSNCNLLVKGRASRGLQRGQKYLVLESELDNDAAFSFYHCRQGGEGEGKVKLDGTAQSLADFQVPSSPSAWARREMLVQGFASHLGCKVAMPDGKEIRNLPQGSPGRVYLLVKSTPFNTLIFLCVLASVATLAATDPAWSIEEAGGGGGGETNAVLQAFMVVDRVTTAVFTVEAGLKIWAYDSLFVYLKDPWNGLDLFVVSTGWVTLLFPNFAGTGAINLTALRTLRVLRTMKYLSGVRQIVETFTRTLSMVLQGLFIYTYFILLFAMAGTYAWGDALSHRCLYNRTVIQPARYCHPFTNATPVGLDSACPAQGSTCAEDAHLDAGFTGFHNFGSAVFTVFKLSSKSRMGPVLHGLINTRSSAAIAYALAITLFLSLMVFALFVAIVRGTFTSVRAAVVCRPHKEGAMSRLFRRARRVHPASAKANAVDDGKKEGNTEGLQAACQRVVQVRTTQMIIHAAILLNVVFLGLESHEQSPQKTDVLEAAELVFLILFTVELAVNVGAEGGLHGYLVRSKNRCWNQLDAFIVISSLLDLCFNTSKEGPSINLSFLRVFRLFRVLKLLRKWPQVLRIMDGMRRSLPGLYNLMLFWLLVVVIFAILGMQLYGARLPEEPNGSRATFDDFPTAVMTLFKMMTGGAQWNVFHRALEVQGGIVTPLFFIGYSVLTVYITLNFMIVIIMSKFAMTPAEIAAQRTALKKKLYRQTEQKRPKKRSIVRLLPPLQPELMGEEESIMAMLARLLRSRIICVPRHRFEYSLFVFAEDSRVRKSAREVTTHVVFEAMVFIAITASSIVLALDSPLNARDLGYQRSVLFSVLRYGDMLFLVIFTTEFILKVMAEGLLLPRHGYLRSGWNQLDFVVLVVTFLGMIQAQGRAGRILRMLRVLRPLRMVSHNEGLRVIVDALFSSIKPVSYTLLLILCFFFIYSILGIYFFVGQFWRCNDGSIQNRQGCVGHYVSSEDYMLRPRIWHAPSYGYDNVAQGMMTLFETITLKAWTVKLNAASDVAGAFNQPRPLNAPITAALFHICFIFIGNFFLMKLFVGIVVGTFRQFSGNALLTPSQIRWLKVKKKIRQVRPLTGKRQGFSRIQNITLRSTRSILDTSGGISWGLMGTARERGVVAYMRESNWNLFDSIATVLFVALGGLGTYEGGAFVKGLNFTRLTALMPKVDGMRRIVHVLSDCLLPMFNVTAIMFTVLFIYAVLGMQLFAGIKRGLILGSIASFDDFSSSILTLFQVISGDNWIALMTECSVHPPYCQEGFDCGSPTAAKAYFYIFYLLVFGLFANLYMATIIDLYVVSAYPNVATTTTLSDESIQRFQRAWAMHDTRHTQRLAWGSVDAFLNDVGKPLVPAPREDKVWWMEIKREIEGECKTGYSCTLPSGQLSTRAMPSVAFGAILAILTRSAVPQSWLSEAEQIELQERKRVHRLALHVTTVQSRLRGRSVRRQIIHKDS